MIALRPYSEYKPSGFDWLGEVPANWDLRRLKYSAAISPSKSESPMVNATESVPFVPMERLGVDGSIDGSLRRLHQEVRNGFTYFREQDVLLAKITSCFENGKAGVVAGLDGGFGYGSTEYHVLRALGSLTPQHLYRIVSSKWFRTIGQDFMEGSAGQKRVPTDFIANFPIPLPPLDEQRAIADFLDAMDAKVTRFIAARRRMIALLEEQKAAIINQAVTRGLDPDVPLKPSGFDWLGDIPAHWEVRKIGHCFQRIGSGTTPQSGNPLYHENGTVPWVNTGDLNDDEMVKPSKMVTGLALADHSALSVFPAGSLIIAMYGATIGKTGIPMFDVTVNQACCVLAHSPWFSHRYAQLIFIGLKTQVVNLAVGGGQPNISQEIIRQFRVPIPPCHEQHETEEHLNMVTARIGQTISRAQREIDLIREYRSRLISDVVTGKLDVRGVVLPALDEVVDASLEQQLDVEPENVGEIE